jgi:hypothetical protein
MLQLHLPHDHTEADLVLASRIASAIDSGELFITWTHGRATRPRPTATAEPREPVNLTAEVINALFDCAAEFLRALTRPGLRPGRGPAAEDAAT